LILVDLQKDFCPGGSLAVSNGDKVMPVLQQYAEYFHERSAPIVATRDWHPPDHCSFLAQGGSWPPHCVQHSPGAQFHPAVRFPAGTMIISKGTDPAAEAYSGFQGTDLAARLRAAGVDALYIGGLATDYCVKETVLDGMREGFGVTVLLDGCRAVERKAGDGARAIEEMRRAGARLNTSYAAFARAGMATGGAR
jgi:nicotinamidase/pyrazinamidase